MSRRGRRSVPFSHDDGERVAAGASRRSRRVSATAAHGRRAARGAGRRARTGGAARRRGWFGVDPVTMLAIGAEPRRGPRRRAVRRRSGISSSTSRTPPCSPTSPSGERGVGAAPLARRSPRAQHPLSATSCSPRATTTSCAACFQTGDHTWGVVDLYRDGRARAVRRRRRRDRQGASAIRSPRALRTHVRDDEPVARPAVGARDCS